MLHPTFLFLIRKRIGAPQDPGTKNRNLGHPATRETLEGSLDLGLNWRYRGLLLSLNRP